MLTFKLIGRTNVFRVVRRVTIAGIACVVGQTLNNKYQTVARVIDVEWLA